MNKSTAGFLAIFFLCFFRPASATVMLAGLTGSTLNASAFFNPQFDSKSKTVYLGIPPEYANATAAFASGTSGSAFSSAQLSFSANTMEGTWSFPDTSAASLFIHAQGSVSIPVCFVSCGYSNALMDSYVALRFLTDSTYHYSVDAAITRFYNSSTDGTRAFLEQRIDGQWINIFSASGDSSHTVSGTPTGELLPGEYRFGSAVILGVFSSQYSWYSSNSINSKLILNASVPLPASAWLFLSGLSTLIVGFRRHMAWLTGARLDVFSRKLKREKGRQMRGHAR